MTEASDTNVTKARRFIDALNRGEIEEALSPAREDFVMDWSNSIGPMQGVYDGKAEVIGLWKDFIEAFEEVRWDPEEIIRLDESAVLVVNRVRMRGRESGVEVRAGGAQLWRFDEDGRGQSVKLYQTKEEALEAIAAEPS